MPSDCSQDRFVIDTLQGLKNGSWVELGCQGPHMSSNTHILEQNYDWSGLSIDLDESALALWEGVRNTEHLLKNDATTLVYETLFEEHNIPEVVDYFSVDLEPPPLTFEALQRIPFDKYKFKVITFEHDDYREGYKDHNLKERSREFFANLGYYMIPESFASRYHPNIDKSEDWYVHPDYVDTSMFQ